MEINKNLRTTIKPSNDLYRRDVRSKLVNVQTGKFTRNCVLSGKATPDMSYPIYIRTPGVVSPVGGLTPEGLGYLDSSEGNSGNVLPQHKDLTNNNTYWSTSTENSWVSYCHPERPTTISSYRFITINGYTPNSWRIEGSLDNVSWVILHSVTATWSWDDGKNMVQYDIPLENRNEYKYHRLVIETLDSSEVRIYSLQFYDSLCNHKSSFYLDASAENPLQLAFADGYNVDGTPKDILYTIDTGIEINLSDLLQYIDTVNNTMPLPCTLFAEYDPDTSSVSFLGELANQDVVMNTNNFQVLDYDLSGGLPENIYIDNSSYADFGSFITLGLQTPRMATKFAFRTRSGMDSYPCTIYISEDFGSTWENCGSFVSGSSTKIFTLDRAYYATQIKIAGGGYQNIYYFALLDSSVMQYKLSDGKIYQYDPDTDTWNQKYKIPLGYFYVWLSPDGTQNEIGHFIPTHIPQMSVAPYFTKTT